MLWLCVAWTDVNLSLRHVLHVTGILFCRYVLKRHLLKFEGQYGESEKRFFRLSLYTTEKQKWYDRLFPHF